MNIQTLLGFLIFLPNLIVKKANASNPTVSREQKNTNRQCSCRKRSLSSDAVYISVECFENNALKLTTYYSFF